jgi:hypothetical protein
MQMLDLRAYNLTVSKVCNLQSAICNLQSAIIRSPALHGWRCKVGIALRIHNVKWDMRNG